MTDRAGALVETSARRHMWMRFSRVPLRGEFGDVHPVVVGGLDDGQAVATDGEARSGAQFSRCAECCPEHRWAAPAGFTQHGSLSLYLRPTSRGWGRRAIR